MRKFCENSPRCFRQEVKYVQIKVWNDKLSSFKPKNGTAYYTTPLITQLQISLPNNPKCNDAVKILTAEKLKMMNKKAACCFRQCMGQGTALKPLPCIYALLVPAVS